MSWQGCPPCPGAASEPAAPRRRRTRTAPCPATASAARSCKARTRTWIPQDPFSAAQVRFLRQCFTTGNSTSHSGTIKFVLHFSTPELFPLLFQLGSFLCLLHSQPRSMRCCNISKYLHNPCINCPLKFLLKDITKKSSQCSVASQQLLHCIVLINSSGVCKVFPSTTSGSHTYNPEVKKAINGVIIIGCVLVSILLTMLLLSEVAVII